jgi:hypothetical protein
MKIKTCVLLFFALSCLNLYSVTPALKSDSVKAVTVSGNVDLMSRYIWRGLENGHAPSIQPGLSVSWKGFTLGAWGAYKLTGEGGQETDFYLSKNIAFVTIAVWDYWNFYDTAGFNYFDYHKESTTHILEAQVLFSGNKSIPFNLLVSYFFYGADTSKSIYMELQFFHKFKPVDLVVFTGYQPKGTYYASRAAFVNIGCTVKKSIPVTDRFSLPLSLSLIFNPAGKSTYLVAGITL